jgi:hypothetical protein
MPQGTLFTEDFLSEGICGTEPWRRLPPGTIAEFRRDLDALFTGIADPARLDEANTEEGIVRPILRLLGLGRALA